MYLITLLKKKYSVLIFLVISILVLYSSAQGAGIKSVNIEKNPYAIRIKLSAKVPYKVVQFDKKEILVAFKNIGTGEIGGFKGDGSPDILDVKVAKRKRDVVSLIISTRRNVISVSSVWIPVGNTLLVKPVFKKTADRKEKKKTISDSKRNLAKTSGGKTKKRIKKRPAGSARLTDDYSESEPDQFMTDDVDTLAPQLTAGRPKIEKEEEIGFKLGGRVFDERFDGSTDDLFLELRSDACEDDASEIKRALVLCRQGAWLNAFEIFSRYVEDDNVSKRCLENIHILRAYSFYKEIENGTDQQFLEAIGYFQDVISYFPESIYLPYAVTSLGKMHVKLKDLATAEGYFKIILKNYIDYPGTPEVLFELGRIYAEKKNTKLAVAMLKKVVDQFPHGKFIGTAKLALGKSLFNQNDFYGTIKILEDVIKTRPRLIFTEPSLLHYLGNAFYHTNQNEKARNLLSKVYNIFPEIEGRDTILTRIGDTFVEEKQIEKAINIFKLVVKKYPGTDGFVISSMRLAEFLEVAGEKKQLYNMIIQDYPDNPLARLALMRLALLSHKEGDYEESVATIKRLLATQPRALRNDAINLLLSSSEEIFKKQISSNEYTALLKRFENDKRLLNKSDNPNMFLLVGMAYLKAHLYDTAVEQLMKSYKRTGKNNRPAELFYSLGVAMKELGRNDEAYNMFKTYVRYFSSKKDISDVYNRMGKIMLEKKKAAPAVSYFEKALLKSHSEKKKAAILVSKAMGHKMLKQHEIAVNSLIKAINMLASDPDESYETLSAAHRNLGENYMALERWNKASDALNMAVKFAGIEKSPTEIYFLLGESFEKGKDFKQAEKAYNNVVENGDSFWSSMARERLRGMKLNNRLENT